METNVERVEIFKGEDDQYYYRAVAANNETLNTSEGYTRSYDASYAASKVYPGVFQQVI